jgi:hypothetical protein
MPHLPESLLPFVRRHFVTLPFLTTRHETSLVGQVEKDQKSKSTKSQTNPNP